MSLSISPENFGPICDELLDCPTGLVESIEHRHDLLNIFGIWVHVVVKKGVDQRQIFGTELFLQFIYLSDQLLSFLPVFLLSSLVDLGNTVVVIEHQLDVVKTADWIIDLGPEGGERGGQVVASGTPEEILRHPKSYRWVNESALMKRDSSDRLD